MAVLHQPRNRVILNDVAGERHDFSRTAEEQHLTQHTLSKLLELQDGVGVRLFDRHTRNVKLTRDGLALLPCSAAELFRIDDLRIAPLTGGPRRSVGIVTRREGETAPLAARLMRELRILGAQRGTPAIDGPAR